MNKRIYSLIWNRSLNQVVVASELASCKGSGSSATAGAGSLRRSLLVLALLSAIAALPMHAFAGDTSCGGSNQNASGAYSVTCGLDARATGYESSALGVGADASGTHSLALGSSYASGAYSSAVGGGTHFKVGNFYAYTSAKGKYAAAFGNGAEATAARATAIGALSAADQNDTALGYFAHASALNTTAVGLNAYATSNYASAIGENAHANGTGSTALGASASAASSGSTALGYKAKVTDPYSVAVGSGATAVGNYSSALGDSSDAAALAATALGSHAVAQQAATAVGQASTASGQGSTALGFQDSASGAYSDAFGYRANAGGKKAVALGLDSVASGVQAFALGPYSQASGSNATALGGAINLNGNGTIDPGEYTLASGGLSLALGSAAQATQDNATAIGGLSQATGTAATAIGSDAMASGSSSVAIGFGSIASAANTVSFGGNGVYRELVNIADPTSAHSAVDLEYLQAHYTGHAAFDNAIGGLTSEFNALAAEMDALQKQYGGGSSSATPVAATERTAAIPTPKATAGTRDVPPPVPQEGAGARIATNRHASATRPAAGDATRRSGTGASDDIDIQTREALASTQAYSDMQGSGGMASAAAAAAPAVDYVTTDQFNQFEQQVNARFSEVDKRIDQIGAAGAAWAGLAQNTSGSGANSVGIGVGSQGSQQAIAVGYRRALGEHASFSFGGAASSGKASVSAGVGFNW